MESQVSRRFSIENVTGPGHGATFVGVIIELSRVEVDPENLAHRQIVLGWFDNADNFSLSENDKTLLNDLCRGKKILFTFPDNSERLLCWLLLMDEAGAANTLLKHLGYREICKLFSDFGRVRLLDFVEIIPRRAARLVKFYRKW
jgi:hypothetical protein